MKRLSIESVRKNGLVALSLVPIVVTADYLKPYIDYTHRTGIQQLGIITVTAAFAVLYSIGAADLIDRVLNREDDKSGE